MPEVTLECEFPGCEAKKKADDIYTALQLLQLHHQQAHSSNQALQKPPKIERPPIRQGVNEEDWAAFTRRWDLFKRGTDIPPSQITAQLLACCEPDLESALFRNDPKIADKSEKMSQKRFSG